MLDTSSVQFFPVLNFQWLQETEKGEQEQKNVL